MKLVMVGTGYVGLVSGCCFAALGHDVVCVDLDETKINMLKKGQSPIYEPDLEQLIVEQTDAGRLSFTTDLKEALKDVNAVFIAVGTPPRAEDGHADLQYIYQAAEDIAKNVDHYAVLVTKSTVPVGTAREIESIISNHKKPTVEIDVCSNPEFLREGSAIQDFLKADRVVLGAETPKSIEVLSQIYAPLTKNKIPLKITSCETAEIIKYAANAFLATKITFINEIADLCEASGGNVMDVAEAMGMDKRISPRFLNSSPGYGGSCFPKDTLALTQTGKKLNASQSVVEAVIKANKNRQIKMAQKIITACGGTVEGKKIGVLGVAFKPNTDDMRDAPSLIILPLLQQAGAQITAYDPKAQEEAQKELKNIDWKNDPYDVAHDADAIILMTKWDEFKSLCMTKIGEKLNKKIMIDLHNIFDPKTMYDTGFYYASIGRPDTNGLENNKDNNIMKAAS